MTVQLIEVTEKNLRQIIAVKVAPDQESFVANNAVSIAQAYFEPVAWFRAIADGEDFVGFVMLFNPALSEKPVSEKEREEMYLWRFMIAADQQGKGYGRQALDLVCDHARSQPGFKRVLASFVDAPGGPEKFYIDYGFRKTGNIPDGEVEIVLDL